MDQSQDSGSRSKRSASEIERIRELVVGPQLRQSEQKVSALQKDIERLQREIHQLNNQLNEQNVSVAERLQSLRQDLQESVDDVRSEMREVAQGLEQDKVDRQMLGDLFIELGNHIKEGGAIADVLQNLFDIE